LSIVATQLIAEVSTKGVSTAQAELASMGGSADVAGASLAAVGASADGVAASLSTASDALLVQGQAISANGEAYMSLSAVLAEVDALFNEQRIAITSDGEAIVSLGAVMADLAASADTTAAQIALESEAQAQAAATADYLAASTATVPPALKATSVSADTATTSLDATAASEAAASDGAAGLALGLGIAAAALALVAAKSASMAGNFQQEMTSLVTGAGEAESNLGMVSQGILKLAVDTGTSTKQLSDGMYMIESAGQHGAQALATLQAAAMGAKVGNAALADVANGVTTAMTDYAASGLSAVDATNTLVTAVGLGKTHMQDLAASMSTILPTSAAVGVKFGDVAAAMATMTGEGTDAASAATYLRQLLMALEAPAGKGAKALKEIGLSSQEVADMMKKSLPDTLKMITDHLKQKFPEGSAAYVDALKNIAGGSKQMQGILELTGSHLSVFQDNLKGVTDATKDGSGAIKGWDKVQGDFNFALDRGKEVVETLGIKIGTGLLPLLTPLINDVSGVASAFGDWLTSGDIVKQLAGPIASLQQIVTPVFAEVSDGAKTFKDSLSGLFTHIDIKPLTDGLNQIARIMSGEAIQNLKFFGDTVKQVSDWFKTDMAPAIQQAMPGFQALGHALMQNVLPALAGLWANGQQIVRSVMPPLIQAFEKAEPIIVRIAGFIDGLLGWALKNLMPYVTQAGNAVAKFASDISTRVQPIITNVFNAIKAGIDFISPIWNAIWPTLSTIVKNTWDIIANVIGIAWDIISGIVKIALDLLSGNWKQAWQDLVDMLSGIWGNILNIIKDAWNSVTTYLGGVLGGLGSLFSGPLGAIGNFFHGLWDGIVNGVKVAWKWIGDVIHAGIQFVVDLVHDRINKIVGFFSWLYDHNYYFKMLVDKIREIIGVVLTWLHDSWQTTINNLAKLWDGIKDLASKTWNAVSTAVMGVINPIVHWVQDRWNESTKWLGDKWNSFSKMMSDAWSAVSGVISGAWSAYIAGPIGDLWNKLSGAVGGWAKMAIDWGKGLIQGFIDGIVSMAANVGAGLNVIFDKIKGLLGFHSPAKEGEGRHIIEWGQGMIEGFSQGIIEATPHLQAAVNLALNAGIAPMPSYVPAGVQIIPQTQMAAQQPQIIVQAPPVYLDGRLLASGLMPYVVDGIRHTTGNWGI
jgi:TP901 family phage tail tape measure protein